jgi:putative oxidoreductase
MKRLLMSGTRIQSGVADFGLTLLRVAAGAGLALGHGIHKMPVKAEFIAGVESLGFPAPVVFAWAAALAELAGGSLLALGLFTRPAALFVAFTMGVAFFLQHADDPFQVKELAMLYGMAAVAFLFMGSGRFALDRIFHRREG